MSPSLTLKNWPSVTQFSTCLAWVITIFGSDGHNYEEEFNYEVEYLIHGVIEGRFYKAVPYDKLCELGSLKHLSALYSNTFSPFTIHEVRAIPGEKVNYTINELRQLRTIAPS